LRPLTSARPVSRLVIRARSPWQHDAILADAGRTLIERALRPLDSTHAYYPANSLARVALFLCRASNRNAESLKVAALCTPRTNSIRVTFFARWYLSSAPDRTVFYSGTERISDSDNYIGLDISARRILDEQTHNNRRSPPPALMPPQLVAEKLNLEISINFLVRLIPRTKPGIP